MQLLMITLPYALVLQSLWVPVREIWGEQLFTAGQVLMFLLVGGAVLGYAIRLR